MAGLLTTGPFLITHHQHKPVVGEEVQGNHAGFQFTDFTFFKVQISWGHNKRIIIKGMEYLLVFNNCFITLFIPHHERVKLCHQFAAIYLSL